MERRERVLKRIDQVLELEASPEVAYPLRARLGRAMTEAASYFASIDPTDARSTELAQRAGRIMQPSEPFDGVWQKEWTAATDELRRVRGVICQETVVGQ